MDLNNRKEYGPVSHKRDDNKETNNAYKFLPVIPLRKNFYKKKWFIILSIVVAVAAVLGLAAWYLLSVNSNLIHDLFPTEEDKIAAQYDEYKQQIDEAEKLVNTGDSEAAVKAYDEVINNADDPYKKSLALLSKANIYYNDQDYDKALEIAKEAELVELNYNVAYFIASAYNANFEYAKSIEYYTKAIGLIDDSQPLAAEMASYCQSQIAEMQKVMDETGWDGVTPPEEDE
jgi:tetratricopeptide (TPR) repeat protein